MNLVTHPLGFPTFRTAAAAYVFATILPVKGASRGRR